MHTHQGGPLVGRVIGLWRYPVKSMGCEPLTETEVSWHGLAGDRRWAFVRDGVTQSAFPWLTLRQRPDMSHYRPAFTDPADPERSALMVRTPSGATLDVMAPALAQELEPGARVMRQQRGIFDTFPLSLISTGSMDALSARLGAPLDVQRFRPNILVEARDQTPFAEDGWVGRVLRVGGVRLRIDARDGRCAVITIDPASARRDAAILRTVVRERDGFLGVYGTTVRPGRVALGDAVLLEPDGA